MGYSFAPIPSRTTLSLGSPFHKAPASVLQPCRSLLNLPKLLLPLVPLSIPVRNSAILRDIGVQCALRSARSCHSQAVTLRRLGFSIRNRASLAMSREPD